MTAHPMSNPWGDLPAAGELVLPMDDIAVRRYNATARESHKFHLDLMPEPFLGRHDAPVVVLMGNPGFSSDDLVAHENEAFRDAARRSLADIDSEWPFHLLDPAFEWTSGARWWIRHLRALIEVVGREKLARGLLVLEATPYHSSKFRRAEIPSQAYTDTLLMRAIKRGAPIVLARGPWLDTCPSLPDYDRLLQLNNRQRVWVTPNRPCPAEWWGFRSVNLSA